MYYGKKENSISNGCSICSGTAFGDDCNHSTGILNVPDDKGIGYFYWEPEWIPVEGGTYATSAGVAYKNDTVTPSNTWDNYFTEWMECMDK